MVWKQNISSLVFFLVLLSVLFMAAFVSASPPTAHGFKANLERVMTADMPDKCHRMIQKQVNRSKDVCADIIGPKQENSTKQEARSCSTLIVWVPKKTGFTEFVEVSEQCEVKGGFSIAIFCYALRQLPFEVTPIFVPFVNKSGESKGSYDDLLRHINGENCTAVAGDVTIRGSRAQYIDFTVPYMSSEIYMLVRASPMWNQTLLTLLKPFTVRLWLMIIGACIFIGVGIAVLEYREGNPEFMIPFYRRLILVIWFPISTFFFNEGRIVNRCSKVVLVMWLSMIFIVMQIFTACLSSWLTLDQLQPKLPLNYEHVGYQSGSFLQNFTVEFTHCSPDKIRALSSIHEYRKALSNGSVNVIFDELPYIDLFLARYNSDYMKFGPITQEPGIAFAFPLGSPLAPIFSRAVINVIESPDMTDMKRKYLGFSSDPDQSQTAHDHALPQSLDVHSFIGLFIVMGTVTIFAIIWSEISLFRRPTQILPLLSIHK